MEKVRVIDNIPGREGIYNPIQGMTGLCRYKVTDTQVDCKNLASIHFTGWKSQENPPLSIIESIMSVGCSLTLQRKMEYFAQSDHMYRSITRTLTEPLIRQFS